MSYFNYISSRLRCAHALVLLSLLPASAQFVKDPARYVNPNIGGIGHLLQPTTPWVQLPHSMTRLAAVTTPGVQDRYLANKIYGFPLGGVVMIPGTGESGAGPAEWASGYDHDNETATPYYGSEFLDKYDTTVEYTVARRAAYYRVTFPAGKPGWFAFNAGKDGSVQSSGASALSGFGENDGVRTYFYAEFSRALTASRPWEHGQERGLLTGFAPGSGKLEIRVGISFISAEQAHKNLLTDIPNWQFEALKTAAHEAWNQALGRISIQGGTEEQRTIFYTALYRTMGRMIDITEVGGIYKGLDGQTHEAGGHSFYADDGLWDTHRTAHPLQLLLDPARQVDMVRSYLRMYDQTGWLPAFPTVGAERAFMIGHHTTPFIVDTYMKGYRDFDVEKAYAAMRKNALESTVLPWRRGPLTSLDRIYQERGFFPALNVGEKETVSEVHSFEGRQAVAVTLENCLDDWALAQMAKALHKDADYALFSKRALNYRNVFDERIGFMAPKNAAGEWVEGFDPKRGGGQGGRAFFAECNSWVYSFHVQQDVAGLMNLMGGRDRFVEHLDQLFEEQYGGSKFDFLKQFPDATGLIGQYAQGNEPSFHIPYLYNYAGQPWKAQRRLREIMKLWYNAGPLGICGDEDGGAMSSWYVFSAMGFYPIAPGRPVYVIGSPLFDEVQLKLAGGKMLTITAHTNSAKNKYIQSATLNGKPLNRAWFQHADVANGGRLVFEMGPAPNKKWGAALQDAPPSATPEK